jgi:hypothetical protein
VLPHRFPLPFQVLPREGREGPPLQNLCPYEPLGRQLETSPRQAEDEDGKHYQGHQDIRTVTLPGKDKN